MDDGRYHVVGAVLTAPDNPKERLEHCGDVAVAGGGLIKVS
jgi:hypothetical protein